MKARPATQADVAELAGVSRGLVSLALSGGGRMSQHTRERILSAARALNYQPHSAAAELAGGDSRRLLLVLPYLDNPYFDQLSRALRKAAEKVGYSLLVMVSDRVPEREQEVIKQVLQMRPAGVIFAGITLDTGAVLELSQRINLCLLDRQLGDNTVWVTRLDEIAAATQVIRHLAKQGYSHLYFATPTSTRMEPIVYERLEACQLVAAQERVPFKILKSHWDCQANLELLTKSHDAGHCAIIAFNDLLAIDYAAAVYRSDWRMGPDVGMVSYDNTRMADHPEFALSSIDQNLEKMAALSVKALVDPPSPIPQMQLIEPFLQVRASSLRSARVS